MKAKAVFISLYNKIKSAHTFLDKHAWLQCIIIGIVLNLTVESLCRHSLFKGLTHMFTSPLVFLFNALIITSVLSICSLFKHRYFFYLFFVCLWLGFGIGNCVLLTMRVTPLEWADLQVVKFSIIRIYLGVFEIILIVAAILAAIAGLVVFYIKCPKTKVNYLKNWVATVSFLIALVSSLIVFRSNNILLSEHVKNIANAYKDYGFNYCFMCSMLDLGIDKPSQYDQNDVADIVNEIESAANNNTSVNNANDFYGDEKPNVIFLQLETFFDVNHLSSIRFSQNPLPNFTRLQKEYTCGYLSVPSIGAGTANTEFEIISGMSLEYFGVGEYPYKTILQNSTSESMCYNLDSLGYTSHAIHNNTAVFYDRNKVFANLGFDTFTSIEYMTNVEFTPSGWAKDNVLISCINDALNSTDGADLVYTITVQSHGKYPSEHNLDLPIKVSGIDDQDTKNSFEYYINELYEVDRFVGELLEELQRRDEKCVVVMYGDHLPSFEISEKDLENGDLFQTEYVVWDNFGLVKKDKDLSTYQLSSSVFASLGINNGIVTKLHQNFTEKENYQKWLEVLQYDMLYGEKFAFGGKDNYPYKTTQLQMGINEITVDEVLPNEANLQTKIIGKNFTKYSKVFVNDREITTLWLDENTLEISETQLKAGDKISVGQVDKEHSVLSTSKSYIIGGTEEHPIVSVDSNNIIYKKQGLKTSTAIAVIAVSVAIISLCFVFCLVYFKRKNKKH